ncbi:MAG TPA: hypothetical protein VHL31_14935 [Geminicoccus sp.]|jgi:hypothetical protein|uniref:hypothetical protein n=1 Tax=Geminicoccus sp. TaxID=2024832 RepID=UPI002E36BCAF|nr:hypothetical protein [Geminicoccus sp.]HEX2527577.1 hypothetical protein [Geminicoccus sp.]
MEKPTKFAIKLEVGLTPAMDRALTQWRRRQADLPTRPEAIRRLVEIGLEVETEKRLRAQDRRGGDQED